VKVIPEIHRAY